MKKQSKILITGGAGYIGSITADFLKKKGYKIFVLDDLSQGHKRACAQFPLFQVDLKNSQAVDQVFKKNKFAGVIHFAALALVGESMAKPDEYFANNVSGTINLLNATARHGVKFFVFSSSAAVYGIPKKVPIPEEAPKKPINPYGQAKYIVEQMLPWYDQAFGLRFVSLRYFNACGAALDGKNGEAHQPETHLIPLLIRAALKKDYQFKLFGNDYPTPDGTGIRDYIHVINLADAHLAALEYLVKGGKSDYFNVGTGKGYSNLEVIKTVKKITGVDFKVKVDKRRPGDPPRLVANNKKIIKVLKWKPKYSDLKTIVETAFRWHKSRPFTLED